MSEPPQDGKTSDPAQTPAPAKTAPPAKRRGKFVGVYDALGTTLDKSFKKRGFASRDLVTHWKAIVPSPYDRVSLPETLKWPRKAGAEGAVLYVQCAAGHALALSHDGARIAEAINLYFGYFLVETVKLSAVPFTPGSPDSAKDGPVVSAEVEREIETALETVTEPELRAALRRLGLGVMSRKR